MVHLGRSRSFGFFFPFPCHYQPVFTSLVILWQPNSHHQEAPGNPTPGIQRPWGHELSTLHAPPRRHPPANPKFLRAGRGLSDLWAWHHPPFEVLQLLNRFCHLGLDLSFEVSLRIWLCLEIGYPMVWVIPLDLQQIGASMGKSISHLFPTSPTSQQVCYVVKVSASGRDCREGPSHIQLNLVKHLWWMQSERSAYPNGFKSNWEAGRNTGDIQIRSLVLPEDFRQHLHSQHVFSWGSSFPMLWLCMYMYFKPRTFAQLLVSESPCLLV